MKVKDRPVFCTQGPQIFVQHLQYELLIVQCLFIVWLHSLHGRAFWWLDSQWHWCQGLPEGMRTNPGRVPAGIDGGVIACFWGGCSCALFTSFALVYAAVFVNSNSVLLLISFWLSHHILVAPCSPSVCSLNVSLCQSVFSPVCVYLALPPTHSFFPAVKDAADCLISPTIEAS